MHSIHVSSTTHLARGLATHHNLEGYWMAAPLEQEAAQGKGGGGWGQWAG